MRLGACKETVKTNIGVHISMNWRLVSDSIQVPRPCMTIGVPIIEAPTLLLRQQANWFAELFFNHRWYETSPSLMHQLPQNRNPRLDNVAGHSHISHLPFTSHSRCSASSRAAWAQLGKREPCPSWIFTVWLRIESHFARTKSATPWLDFADQ